MTPLSPRQVRDAVAARILAEGELVALAVSEQLSGAPSRSAPIRTTATHQPDGTWRLNGSKTYATGARAAGTIVIVAACENGSGTAHFLVSRTADGLTVVQTWDAAGLRGSDSQDLRLDDVRLDEDALVETVGAGDRTYDTTRVQDRSARAEFEILTARALLDDALRRTTAATITPATPRPRRFWCTNTPAELSTISVN